MKISSKDKLFDKGATMQKLLVVPALGLLLAGCNPADGTATGVASNEGFSLYCPNVGIDDNQCVLSDPENPYANETVDNNTKYTLAAAASNERAKFYLWATAQANSQSGENQYNTALSLHQLFDDNANTAAQAQAKAAYESVLDNYYTSSSEVKVPRDFSADAMSMYTNGAIDLAYTGDSGIDDVIKATAGNGWGTGGDAAAVAWENLTAGFAANYTTLEFKVKSDAIETAGNVMVKLDNGASWPAYTGEKAFALSTYGTAIAGKTGWYQISIPVSEFDGAEDVAELLGIHTGYGNGGEIMVADVMFSGDATGNGLVGDTAADGFVYLYRTSAVANDIVATPMSMYTNGAIDVAYDGDSGYVKVAKSSAGNGWGSDAGAAAAAVAWENLAAGFAANYTTLEFKVKSDAIEVAGNVMVKLDNGGSWPNYTGEKAFALSTYGTAIAGKTGWYQISIPVSEFDGAEDVAPLLGIHTGYGNGGEIMVTDVVFTGDATGTGLVSDLEPDGFVTLHRSGSKVTNFRDLVGENLIEPATLDNLYGDSSAATTALSGMGFSYNTTTNTLTTD